MSTSMVMLGRLGVLRLEKNFGRSGEFYRPSQIRGWCPSRILDSPHHFRILEMLYFYLQDRHQTGIA
jgi:hypothetical protein